MGGKILKDITDKSSVYTVVGVVGSIKSDKLGNNHPVGMVYFDYHQDVPEDIELVVKTDVDNQQVVPAIRRAVRAADPELPVFDVKTLPQRISASVVNQRAAMTLCVIFGALALLLSAVGIYGVLAYAVTQRTREFGIRAALGASQREIVGMVVSNGLKLAAVGLAIGAASALMVTRFMTTLLYDVKPADPEIFLAVAAGLGLVAVIASLIPSMRALRIRPAMALRHE